MKKDILTELLKRECSFEAVRSSGPGGQNVNKVNSKVRLRWNLVSSEQLTPREKERFRELFSSRLSEESDVIITASTSRSREENTAAACSKLLDLVAQAKKKVVKRVNTRPTRASVEKRLTGKKKQSRIKEQRAKNEPF